MWREARRYRRNDGSLVSVAGTSARSGADHGRRRARPRAGSPAGSESGRSICLFRKALADIEASVRKVAAALGRPRSGGADPGANARLNGEPCRGGVTDTVWLGGGGRSVSADGPGGAMDGAGRACASARLQGDRVSLEQLLVRPPAVLLRSQYRSGQYSSEQRWLAHPLARACRGSRSIDTDGRLWTCMGPPLIAEIERLRREAAR